MGDRWRRHPRFGLPKRLNADSSSTDALFLYCLAYGFVVMVLFRNCFPRVSFLVLNLPRPTPRDLPYQPRGDEL